MKLLDTHKVSFSPASVEPANRLFHRLRLRIMLGLVLLVAGFAVREIATACTQPPPNPPTVQIMPLPNGCVKIIICDYTTFGAGRGMFCSCALKQVGPIAAIKSLQIFQVVPGATDPVPLAGFDSFEPNANSSQFFNQTQGGNWGGFLGGVTQGIEPGLQLKIVFVVQLAPNATLAQLQQALGAAGPLIGTGGAQPNGTPIPDNHLAVLPAGPITIMPATGPRIDDFFPKEGGEGTVINIIGSGFGNNPNNICAIIMNGDISIPLQVLGANDNRIEARLGPVTPAAQPGPIMIALGHGNVGVFKSIFPDLNVVEPVWVWVRTPQGPEAGSAMDFKPIPAAVIGTGGANPGTGGPTWYFSGPPMNGSIMLVLSNAWPSPAKVRIQARAHDHQRGIGRDLDAYCINIPGPGSLMDCAARICDTIRCAFMQQGMINVNCTVTQVGADAVKLTLSMPDGQIGWGNLNVCVEPAPPPPAPVITGVSTNQACPGDMFFIHGQGFGNNPQNLCVVLMLPNNVSVPLQVISGTDTQIKVMLGQVDCPLAGGTLQGQIMVGLGDGNMGVPTTGFDNVAVTMPVWAWNKTGPATMAQFPFTIICKPPPPMQQWFFSGPPNAAGRICVTLDKPWPIPCKIQIQARAHDHQRGIGRDLHAVCVEIRQGATGAEGLADCAHRICDVITAAFQQQAGIAVNCTVEPDPAGGNGVVLCLSLPDGQIGWGNLNICVEPLPPAPDPVITGVSSNSVCVGDVFCIFGKNFGNCPENICAVIMNGAVSIPLQVIAATDEKLTVVAPEVDCNVANIGQVMVGLGKGQYGRFRPAFFDVFVADDVWTWDRANGPAGMSTFNVRIACCKPPPPPPAPQPQWFFSGPPVDGKICLILSGNWPAPSKVRIQARAHNHQVQPPVGRDLEAYCLEFQGGGTLLDCAKRICDTIRCAFLQNGGLIVECAVNDLGNGQVKLTLSLPEGSIGWGNLNVCVEPGKPNPAPVITNVNTNRIKDGDIITINGANFGNNPDNLCVVVMSGNESIPLEAIDATDNQIKARVGAIRPNIGTGMIMVGAGVGAHGRFIPVQPNLVVRKPVWVWDRNNGPAANGLQIITPIPNGTNPSNAWFFSGPPVNGMLMTTLAGNWPSNALIRIEARAHNHATRIGRDLRAICLQLPGSGSIEQCAQAICEAITAAFLQQAGIVVNCQVTTGTIATQRKLVLTLPNNLPIDWGNLNICVSVPPPEPLPVITAVTPIQGLPGTLVTIRGTNFPTDPNDVCMVAMGPAGSPTAGISVPFEVISSSATQIVGRLGPVHPGAQPGPIMIGIGNGQRGKPTFAFPDIIAELPVWTWDKDGAAAMTGPNMPFRPIPQQPPPQQQWFFSGPPMDGQIMLVLSNAWPVPSKIRIQARAHDHQRGIGRDLEAFCIRLEGGGSILDCAKRICDVIRCAFLQQGNIDVNCLVTQLPDGTVKLTLSMPDGHIDWGNFNVCVEPSVPPTPVITSFTPNTGVNGTIIRVRGTNFPTDPNDICMVVMDGHESVPITVLDVTPGEITGRLGAVRPGVEPGPIMVGVGEGAKGFFRPAFFDVFVEEPTWTWLRKGPAVMTVDNFRPVPSVPPFQQQWFFSGPPNAEGKLCLYLMGNWPANAKVLIQARAHDHQQGIGRDLEAFCIRLPNGGSLLDCAKRICDVIRCAFLQQANIVVNCTVEEVVSPTGMPSVKLTLSLPEGFIGWGNFNVCVEAPNSVPTPVVISEVAPIQGGEGDIITIKGTGFGNNPNNLCAVIMDGSASIPLEVIEATDTQIRVLIGAVPPDAGAGQIMVGRGLGNTGRFRPAFFDVFVADDVWTWNRRGGPMANAPGMFRPIPTPPPAHTQWFFGQQPENGTICLFLRGRWPDPAKIRIEARVHDHQLGIGHDLRAICLEWGSFSTAMNGVVTVTPMSLLSCAQRICDSISCAFFQQAGIAVNCQVIQISDDVVKLVLSLPNGHVDWGNFNVCVQPQNNDPGPVIEIVKDNTPTTVPMAALCWPRTQVGFMPRYVNGFGQGVPWTEWPDPVVLEGTKLKVRVDLTQPHEFFQLYRQPPIITNPD